MVLYATDNCGFIDLLFFEAVHNIAFLRTQSLIKVMYGLSYFQTQYLFLQKVIKEIKLRTCYSRKIKTIESNFNSACPRAT